MAATTDPWQVTLNSRGYQLDLSTDAYQHTSVPMVRGQADTGDRPGEQSLNPAGLWKRQQSSWHHGAGQGFSDRDADADPFRYNDSAGVDVWTKHKLSLLAGTAQARSAAFTGMRVAVCTNRLYFANNAGTTVQVSNTNDITTWATATGTPASSSQGLATDGTTVYCAFGSNGLYSATGTVFASHSTGTAHNVWYAKGRLIVRSGTSLYNVITSGGAITSGTLLITHPNTTWDWVGCAGAGDFVYVAGSSGAGNFAGIYRVGIKPDGTALDVAVPAAELAAGERIYSLTSYLGYLIIGTEKGVRFAVPGPDGDLSIGKLIPTTYPVKCAEGQGQYAWYGLSGDLSTGLGRMDLTAFTSELTPAYAPDVMVTTTGTANHVFAVATFNGATVFTVDGWGLYYTSGTVASGWISLGRTTYGLDSTKSLLKVRAAHDALPAAAELALAVARDGGSFTTAGTNTVDATTSTEYALTSNTALDHELKATLTGSVAVRSLTLLADPSSERTRLIRVPIQLRSTVTNGAGETAVDVAAERDALDALHAARTVVTYAEGDNSWSVVLDDFQWIPDEPTATGADWQGVMICQLKVVA